MSENTPVYQIIAELVSQVKAGEFGRDLLNQSIESLRNENSQLEEELAKARKEHTEAMELLDEIRQKLAQSNFCYEQSILTILNMQSEVDRLKQKLASTKRRNKSCRK